MELKQKAILVGVHLNNQLDFTNSMEELLNLANACDIGVVGGNDVDCVYLLAKRSAGIDKLVNAIRQ